MDNQGIQKIVDQIVGTEGILRIPSWWMHKILSALVKYCEENEGASVTIKEYIESQLNVIGKTIEDLDTRLENIESHELFEIVSGLPSEPKDNTIYLIPSQNGEGNNVLTEWVYINGTWEQFGEFKTNVDLSEYAKQEALDELLEEIAKKQDALVSGENIKTINGQSLVGEGNIEINTDTPDWNALEGEEGYIKNKPFGLEYYGGDLVQSVMEMPIYYDIYLSYKNDIVHIPHDIRGQFQINEWPLVNIEITDTPSGLKSIQLIDNYNYYSYLDAYWFAKKVDDVFIPDTVARKSDIDSAISNAITNELNGDF